MSSKLGAIENARSPEQIQHMQNTIGKGICCYCPPDPKLNKIFWQGKHVMVWENPFPYIGHRNHVIITTIKHVTDFVDLEPEAWAEVRVAFKVAGERLGIKGGALVMRFGDLSLNAGTLQHIHWQIQEPDLTTPAFAVFAKVPRKSWRKWSGLLKRAFLLPEPGRWEKFVQFCQRLLTELRHSCRF